MKKPSKAKQAKIDFLASLPSLGWTVPADRFGHFKMTVSIEGTEPVLTKQVRLKIATTSWRLEREVLVAAMPALGLGATRAWIKIKGGFFNDPDAPSAAVPTFKAKA